MPECVAKDLPQLRQQTLNLLNEVVLYEKLTLSE